MTGKQKLSPKEIKTCELYLKGYSLKRALETAGYSPTYCEGNTHLFNWIKRRHICDYLRQRQAEIALAENLDKAELIKHARKILSDNDFHDRVKALEILVRLGLPVDDNTLVKGDVAGITINFTPAEKKDNT